MDVLRRATDPRRRAAPPTTWSLLVHTLRWLPPAQIAALARQRLQARLEWPERFAARHVPPDPGVRWSPGAFPDPAPVHDADALAAGRFEFVNRCESLGWPPRWDPPGTPLLWVYNLHYFDYLWSLPYDAGREVVLDWIERHPLARDRVGWAPYPTSLRLLNWCAWLFGRHRERAEADAGLRAKLWPSVWLQAEWLARHPETHLRANHLLENAAALAFCGACFGGPGERWLEQGAGWLDRELPEQVLADGMHFERSPMYHARLVVVLALLEATHEPELARRVVEPLARARDALARLSHPDGDIALLNDSAFGIQPPAERIVGAAPPQGAFALREAGYYGARSGGHYVVCDAAPVGPDYNPGHAHADLLSFELSLGGRRVIVDAGVHGYDGDPLRAWCRSTQAHNTVEIDGADQCEMWGTFRVARRARPRDVVWEPDGAGFRLAASHDGYDRLAGRPRHAREFRWYDEGVLLVRDRVSASCEVTAVSRLHLHPKCTIESLEDRVVRVRHPGGVFCVAFDGEGELAVEDSMHCPEFGRAVETHVLAFASRGRRLESGFCIADGGEAPAFERDGGVRISERRRGWGASES